MNFLLQMARLESDVRHPIVPIGNNVHKIRYRAGQRPQKANPDFVVSKSFHQRLERLHTLLLLPCR
jgi:hypothetical protein